MKLKLGAIEIQMRRISKVIQTSENTAQIKMLTGESFRVKFNQKASTTKSLICYQGSVEELKRAISDFRRMDEGF